VTGIDTATGVVTVGPPRLLEVTAFRAAAPVWFDGPPAPGGQLDCTVQVRAHGEALPCRVSILEPAEGTTQGTLQVDLARPIRGLAAGQSAVFYGGPQGDLVLAQGTIQR
jgi:tRNA-specific 2-thiouridylase